MAAYLYLVFILTSLIVEGQSENVALTTNHATCTASVPDDSGQNADSDCGGAIDGFSSVSSSLYRWAYFGDPSQAWIKIVFSEKYFVDSARFMQLYYADETNIQTIRLEFESSPSQEFTFSERVDNYTWEKYLLSPPVRTSFVNISIVSAFTTASTTPYSGFSEIEILSQASSNGDTVACTDHLDVALQVCYVLVTTRSFSWQLADDACADAYNGHLATILDAQSDGIVAGLIEDYVATHGPLEKEVYVGAQRENSELDVWRRMSDRATTSGQGCYRDQPSARDLPLDVTDSLISVTATNCVEECRGRGHLYAGVQNGALCFCSNSFGRYGTEECAGIPCVGDSSEYCGGTTHNFIYAVNGVFSSWYKEKPNYGKYQSCVVMQNSFGMQFDDEKCSNSQPYLCQIDGVQSAASCSQLTQSDGETFLFDEVCYFFGKSPKSWFEARMACSDRGGKLAEIATTDTLQKLDVEINKIGDIYHKVFIGYTNQIWYWKTGYDLLYSNWGSSKPEVETNAYMAIYDNNGAYRWTDTDGDTPLYYVCETGLPDAPITTTTSTVAPSPIPTVPTTTANIPTTAANLPTTSSTTASIPPSTTTAGPTAATTTSGAQGTTTTDLPLSSTTTANIMASTSNNEPTTNPSATPTTAQGTATTTTTGVSGTAGTTTTAEVAASTSTTAAMPFETSTSSSKASTSSTGSGTTSTTALTTVEIPSTFIIITTTTPSNTITVTARASTSSSEASTSPSEASTSTTPSGITTTVTRSVEDPSTTAAVTEKSTSSSTMLPTSSTSGSTAESAASTTSNTVSTTDGTTPAITKPTFVQETTTATTVGSGGGGGSGNTAAAAAQTGDDNSGLTVLEIVLVVVVCVLVLLVALVIIGFWCWKKENRLNRVYVDDKFDGRPVAGIPSTGKLDMTYGFYGNYGSQDALVPNKNTRARHLQDNAKFRVNMESDSSSTLA